MMEQWIPSPVNCTVYADDAIGGTVDLIRCHIMESVHQRRLLASGGSEFTGGWIDFSAR